MTANLRRKSSLVDDDRLTTRFLHPVGVGVLVLVVVDGVVVGVVDL